MRRAILPSLLLSVLPSLAHADPCVVTISRAPDDVRAAIEAWVSAEPECATTADVRAVPTDGGFYLLAIDGRGRVHERVVPDAQSAGVLVASWIADDGQSSPVRDPAPPPSSPPEAAPARAAVIEAPGTIEPEVEAVATPRKAERRQLSVGADELLSDLGRTALRVGLDLYARGHWTAGVAGTAWSSVVSRGVDDAGWSGWQVSGLADLGYARGGGAWGVRGDLALGISGGRYRMDAFGLDEGFHTWLGEVGVAVTRHVSGPWSVAVGPRVTVALSYGDPVYFAFAALRHTL